MADWITTAEACKLSGYHPDYVRILIRGRKIQARKFGPVWQVSRASLATYLRQIEKRGKKRGPKSGY